MNLRSLVNASRGISLVELIIVMIIISLLTVISVSAYSNIATQVKRIAHQTEQRALESVAVLGKPDSMLSYPHIAGSTAAEEINSPTRTGEGNPQHDTAGKDETTSSSIDETVATELRLLDAPSDLEPVSNSTEKRIVSFSFSPSRDSVWAM